MPFEDPIHFKHGETEALKKVELVQDKEKTETDPAKKENEKSTDKSKESGEGEAEEGKEDTLIFQILLENPTPQGVTIAKQNMCYVEIVPDDLEVDVQ